MNIKTLFLATIIGISTTALTAYSTIEKQHEYTHINSHSPWKNLLEPYASTLIAGGLIGAVTGKTSSLAWVGLENFLKKYCKEIVFHQINNPATIAAIVGLIGIIITEKTVRAKLVDEVHQSFEEHGIKNKKNLTADIAWLAAWIACLL